MYMLSNNTFDGDYLNNSIINIINGILFIIHFIFICFGIMVQDNLKNNFLFKNTFYFIFNTSKSKLLENIKNINLIFFKVKITFKKHLKS